MTLVCDTGPLLAALNIRDKHHMAAVALFDTFPGPLIVPCLVVTEVCYLAESMIGPHAEAKFLDSIVGKELQIDLPDESDWQRIAALVRQYADFPLGAADASVIATAERLGASQIATVDRRHLSAVRPAHCAAFELFP